MRSKYEKEQVPYYVVWIKRRYDEDGHRIENPVWEKESERKHGPKTAWMLARRITDRHAYAVTVLPVGQEPD